MIDIKSDGVKAQDRRGTVAAVGEKSRLRSTVQTLDVHRRQVPTLVSDSKVLLQRIGRRPTWPVLSASNNDDDDADLIDAPLSCAKIVQLIIARSLRRPMVDVTTHSSIRTLARG